jgi:hypothetical protein
LTQLLSTGYIHKTYHARSQLNYFGRLEISQMQFAIFTIVTTLAMVLGVMANPVPVAAPVPRSVMEASPRGVCIRYNELPSGLFERYVLFPVNYYNHALSCLSVGSAVVDIVAVPLLNVKEVQPQCYIVTRSIDCAHYVSG